MTPFRLKALLALAGFWLVVGVVIFLARSAKATPDSLMAYTEQHPVAGQGASAREKIIENVAKDLNQLSYEDRRQMRMSKRLDQFFKSLDPAEQSRFLDLTMPTGFRQMMDAFNKMDPLKRKQMVAHALADMRRQAENGEQLPPKEDDPNMQKIIDQGMHSFYSDASAETKMDLAPIIEQIQKNLQGLH
jgi:hypothetical protein